MSTQYLTALVHDKCKELKKLVKKLSSQDQWEGWSKDAQDNLIKMLDEVGQEAKDRLNGLIVEKGAKPEDYPL